LKDSGLNTQQFYNGLAGDYDDMIRFRERLTSEKKVLRLWSQRYRFKTVLDAGCGSGLHSLALSALGLTVIGVDVSVKMLKQARLNAKQTENRRVKFIQAAFAQLPQRVPMKVDAVFCLGNAIVHCSTYKELILTLHNFHQCCQSEGLLVLQLLNYQKILTDKERIVAINRSAAKEFIRFYDFNKRLLNFNILTINWENQKHTLHTTTLYPYTLAELKPAIIAGGFVLLAVYGSMDFKKYDEKKSSNLVLVARRNNNAT
jgi:glycine/sarcosine N-methyltransferase